MQRSCSHERERRNKFLARKNHKQSVSVLERCLIFSIQHSQQSKAFTCAHIQEHCKLLETHHASRRSHQEHWPATRTMQRTACGLHQAQETLPSGCHLQETQNSCSGITVTGLNTSSRAQSSTRHRCHFHSGLGEDICCQGWRKALLRSWILLYPKNTSHPISPLGHIKVSSSKQILSQI